MPIKDLPICGYFDVQRFKQFGPADAANWYLIENPIGKKKVAMYPTMGRKHINLFNQNKLIFAAEPRAIFKSANYWYAVVIDKIFRIDANLNSIEITGGQFPSQSGNVFFSYLVVGVATTTAAANFTIAAFTDGNNLYLYREDTGEFTKVPNNSGPPNPLYIATFGNRFVVSNANSSTFYLTAINVTIAGVYTPLQAFNTTLPATTFAQEDGVIQQMGVLQNTLYIFTDFTTGIWQNTPAVFPATGESFPFKKNSTFSFDYGLSDPLSLDIDFDIMVWEARNRGGLVQFMYSSGQNPKRISTRAVNILLQKNATAKARNPFLVTQTDGFLYSWEDTIFYRVSLGQYHNVGQLDVPDDAFAIEYNFDSGQWNRVIESNGERSRVKKGLYFSNRHLVTVQGEGTIYEMSGEYYVNELRNPDQANPQAEDAYIAYPFRYERITPIIYEDDYSEFEDEYVEIDFQFGDGTFIKSTDAFENTVYIEAEDSTPENPIYVIQDGQPAGSPVYLIKEGTNTPGFDETTYNTLFKPNVSLYFSDDGGMTYRTADNREFSPLGFYQWRMRWYQLGCSRNRVYKLVCVSPAPIVVLGGVRMTKRVSGGAN